MAIKNQYGRTPEYVVDNLKVTSTDATVGGTIVLTEGRDNGSNSITLKAPDSLSGDVTLTLPSSTGTIGDVTSSSTTTFTNKTLNCDSTGNVITNVGSSEIKSEIITGQSAVSAATGDYVMISDVSDSNNLKKATVQSILDLASGGGGYGTFSAGTVSTTYITFLNLTADRRYKIIYYNVNFASPGSLTLQVSVDNGSNWLSSGFKYQLIGAYGSTAANEGSTSAAAKMTTSITFGNDAPMSGEIMLYTTTNNFNANYTFGGQGNGGSTAAWTGWCTRASTTVNAVRLASDGGNISGSAYISLIATA